MRKPVLLIDDAKESLEAIRLFRESGQAYVEYHIKKFEESCCGELPTTRAPSVFAPEGIFKGLEGVRDYLSIEKQPDTGESAYW
ncbi:hypothetical protein [Nitrososphaera viennensis]|uniref:Uncharacterized protein n=2 Tax=Nitrososphaera viennensis TaxID=1034015 RepID=A0A060HSZ5_9ARCH|nr:hypothetical protein [Nitrososphaera viennensis]AIC16277.1 hypothetical protein NVIE_020200 [Nitrososphaera viennensis EN76]UVS68215.1 hypothetical protein NWT39_09925 [Nitrososphaera viennensis]